MPGRQRRRTTPLIGPRAARLLPPVLDHAQPHDPPARSPAPTSDPHIPSIVSVYPGNDWHERETWDLIGIVFDGHPSLTRTAMPDDWVGHPQRKDYPLGGIPVEYKGAVNASRRRPEVRDELMTTAFHAPAGATDLPIEDIPEVLTQGGDWDDVLPRSRPSPPSASSSTWARSTPRPTAFCA